MAHVFAPLRREWVLFFHDRRVPLEHIATILDTPLATVRGDISASYHCNRGPAWPFPAHPNEAAARARRIIGDTAVKIRRMSELKPRYTPARIAELLLLDLGRVMSYTARIRRLRPVRGDRRKPGELIRPRTEAEQADAWRAYDRERKRREKRELAKPPAGWSYKDRCQAAATEAQARAAVITAMKEGRLSAGALLDMAAGLYFAPPRPAPPPAAWSGSSSWHSVGSAQKLDPDKIAELRVLRAQGWSTGALAKRYNTTRSNIVHALRRPVHVSPALPSPASIILPASVGEIPETQETKEKPGVLVLGSGIVL
jgi:hypothetical protein